MLETLISWDYNLFELLYAKGESPFESFMRLLSEKWVWVPLYLLLIQQLLLKYGRQSWLPILALVLLVICTDQLTSAWMKPYFARLRPCHDPELQFLSFWRRCGGQYGFASSHAANTMGLAVFINLMIPKRSTIVLIVWAVLVAYSRVYLGVHFPLDILAGMGIGALMATLVWRIVRSLLQPHFTALQ